MLNFKSFNLLTIGFAVIGAIIATQPPMMAQSTSDYHQSWSDQYNSDADWYKYHGDSSSESYYRDGARTQQDNADYYGN